MVQFFFKKAIIKWEKQNLQGKLLGRKEGGENPPQNFHSIYSAFRNMSLPGHFYFSVLLCAHKLNYFSFKIKWTKT